MPLRSVNVPRRIARLAMPLPLLSRTAPRHHRAAGSGRASSGLLSGSADLMARWTR
jgi:hypothetical protein